MKTNPTIYGSSTLPIVTCDLQLAPLIRIPDSEESLDVIGSSMLGTLLSLGCMQRYVLLILVFVGWTATLRKYYESWGEIAIIKTNEKCCKILEWFRIDSNFTIVICIWVKYFNVFTNIYYFLFDIGDDTKFFIKFCLVLNYWRTLLSVAICVIRISRIALEKNWIEYLKINRWNR